MFAPVSMLHISRARVKCAKEMAAWREREIAERKKNETGDVCVPPRLNNICTRFPSISKTFDISISNWPAEEGPKMGKRKFRIFPSSIFPFRILLPSAYGSIYARLFAMQGRHFAELCSYWFLITRPHSIWLKVGRQVACQVVGILGVGNRSGHADVGLCLFVVAALPWWLLLILPTPWIMPELKPMLLSAWREIKIYSNMKDLWNTLHLLSTTPYTNSVF